MTEQSILSEHGIELNIKDLPIRYLDDDSDELKEILKRQGVNSNAGLLDSVKNIESFKTETEYWNQYRGDYLDLRDYLRLDNLDAKKSYLKRLSLGRVTLIREHILTIWTFAPELRDQLEDELEGINLIIYSGPDELDMKESDLERRKHEHGYYANKISNKEISDEEITDINDDEIA